MIHLRAIHLRDVPDERTATFPFSVPAIASLAGQQLAFTSDVTFLVGENGSGKSTFLEALAAAARSITVGTHNAEHDPSLAATHELARAMKLEWSRKTRRGFFMRSEDFFGFARRMQQMRAELEADLRAIQNDPKLSDKAKGLASQPYAREIHDLRRRYGDGLDSVSHGESFLTLFKSRFVPDGLYLLDEPEAPLSPKRLLGFISLLKSLIKEQGAQFIIATHSPILMAFPGATILSFDDGAIQPVAYDELEHVTITRDFLSHPEAFLRHL
jgi:predicted ATPase